MESFQSTKFQSPSTSKSAITIEEKEKAHEAQLTTGPLSILTNAVKNNTQIMINCRNGKKLLGRVKAFDRHMNMVLENIKEIWEHTPKSEKGKKGQSVIKERFIAKLFVRGDGVIIIVSNPSAALTAGKKKTE